VKKKPSQKKMGGQDINLSKEDQAVWENTAQTLKPLRGAKARVLAKDRETGEPERLAVLRSAPPSDAERYALGSSRPLKSEGQFPAPQVTPKSSPRPVAFDRKAARRLKIGRADIEARIDLHGMRQQEAHSALTRFLLSSSAQGLRYVLVITGKGAPGRRTDDSGFGFGDREERGVLKRNVPQWLAEPALRKVVVSFGNAAPSHGGDGALYVHLRSRG
jgi:DNA-nicking Smr family endonuclease